MSECIPLISEKLVISECIIVFQFVYIYSPASHYEVITANERKVLGSLLKVCARVEISKENDTISRGPRGSLLVKYWKSVRRERAGEYSAALARWHHAAPTSASSEGFKSSATYINVIAIMKRLFLLLIFLYSVPPRSYTLDILSVSERKLSWSL